MGSEVRQKLGRSPALREKLVGAKPEIREDKSAAHLEALLRGLEDWIQPFRGTCGGPTEATLWKMLDRRAQASFPVIEKERT
ncbi:hypothetical protein GQ600_21789 [Phytophthora cactorum]|nr:hypothetical protein GQ600_21789 [Phytophthora cactorum]